MNRRYGRGLVLCLPLLMLIAASGCSKKPKPAVTPPPPPPVAQDTTRTTPPPPPPPPPAPAELGELQDAYFDFDKSTIRDDARTALNDDGKMIVDAKTQKVLLEGHCDERGTVEYNLALGQRRADSVKNYLIQYGVDPSLLSTISYGEERPFAQGHDEQAWQQNRRVHFTKQ